MTRQRSHCMLRFCFLVMAFILVHTAALAQQLRNVHGTVKDSSNEPLAGAAVTLTINGKTKGAITDSEGRYSIDVPAGTVQLEFSFIGMKTSKLNVPASTKIINVTLESDNSIEEAVISTGYGVVQKRIDMTGSAYQVTSEEIKSLPKANVASMLDGLVPGLTVTTSQTGSRDTYKLRIRGDASLSANCEPLWIVDDVPIYTGNLTSNSITGMSYNISPISFLNPEDIESITVMKDAASTSIYGADGANGVILVKTRKGTSDGSTEVKATVKHGISAVDKSTLLKYCNTQQWWSLATEGWQNAGLDMANFPYRDNEHNSYSTTDTNWYDVYMGMGSNSNISVAVRSGNKVSTNYLSLSYFNENYTTKSNRTDRISVRDRVTYDIGKRLKLDLNLNVSYSKNNIFSISSSEFRVIPIFSPYDEDGITPRLYNWYSRETESYTEKQYKFVYNYVPKREFCDNDQYNLTVGGSGTATFVVFKGLTITSMFGLDNSNNCEFLYSPSNTLDGITSYEMDGYSRRSAALAVRWTNNNRINFHKSFGKFDVRAMGGTELHSSTDRSVYAYGYGFANDSLKELSFAISSTTKGSSSAKNNRSLSYIADGAVSYDNRYILSGSFRRQGNSAFSVYHQWDSFAAVGLSWVVSREKFWNVPGIDKLKFKVSYGDQGNSRINTSAAYGTYTVSSGSYYGGVSGATQSSTPNPGLSWEKTDIFNLGIDLGLLKNRLDFSFEGYDKYTHDMLYSGRVSSIIENGTVTRNVGSMENIGFEATMTANLVRKANFDWTIQFNGAVNRNKILELYEDMHTGFFDYVWVKGASKNAHWLSRWAGVDPLTGKPMWYDSNGDITYTFSYDNRVLLPEYDKQPDFQGGFVNNIKWGPVSVRMQMNYSFGGWELFNYQSDGYDIIEENAIVEELDHWKEPGDVSVNPAFIYKQSTNSSLGSTRFLYPKTYVQLKNLAVYYNLPKSVSRALKLRNIEVSLIGDNLYLWCPGQSKDRNSYKSFTYSKGVARALSAQIQLEF